MFVRRLLAVLCAGGWAAPAAAQIDPPHRPIRFERSAIEPFLPQSTVYAVHQDLQGFLWFATREGLGRWDGYEMRTWKAEPFRSNALPNNVVRSMVEDGDGNLWVVVVPDNYEPTRLSRLPGPDHESVETLPLSDAIPFVDGDGIAWVADRDSLYRYDRGAGRLTAVRARIGAPAHATAGLVDRSGIVWLGAEGGVLERYDLTRSDGRRIEPVEPWYPGAESGLVANILEDSRGTIWVSGLGLRRLDSTRSRIIRAPAPLAALDTVAVGRMLQDPDGWLWLASLDGVYRFDPTVTRVDRYSLRLPGDIGTQNWVLGLLRDRSGTVWAGTLWGLHRYDPSADAFGFLAHNPNDANSLGSGIVVSVIEDDLGALWAGTLGGGLNHIDRRTGRVRRYRHEPGRAGTLSDDWVWSLAPAGGGRVWAGLGEGIAMVDPGAPPNVTRIPLDSDCAGCATRNLLRVNAQTTYSIHAESAGVLWIGAGNALLRREPGGGLRAIEMPVTALIQRIMPAGRALWLATTAGLHRYEPQTGRFTSYRHEPGRRGSLSNDVVFSLHTDRAGRLWVGTNSGLNRLDPGAGQFVHYGEAEGFPSSVIFSILEADDGRLWLGTNRGLVRFSPDGPAGARVRTYDVTAGTGNVEFNRDAAARGVDGTLYFGGDRGITFFHPASLRDNPFVPPVVLTAVHRSTREGTRTTRHVAPGEPVRLAPEEYTVSFSYTALNYTNPSRNRYRYRLEGFDRQWIEAGTIRTASYTNLPAGTYQFRVQGSNDDGLWNEEGLSIPVIAEPWFWETWWFRLLSAVAVAALVSASTAYVLKNRHRRQLQAVQYQKALEGERARISRDMHDEVGASLTEIALLSELALSRRSGNGSGDSAPLEKIAGRSRSMLSAIGEIIWAINPANDRLDHLAAYLHEYAAEFLENAGVEARLCLDHGGVVPAVTAEFRRNVFLVLKESLANAVRHGGAKTVDVALDLAGDRLRLSIADDGRGFSPDAAAPGSGRGHHGLGNIRRRAAELGGGASIDSSPGQGTRVVLDVPIPRPVAAGR